MSESDIIKEYLIALGYEPNQDQLNKFNAGIEKASKTVQALGNYTKLAALEVVAGVDEMSRQLENLYYVAQRSTTTVQNLQAIRFAGGQIGLGADEITSNIENLRRQMNLNPGTEGLINQLGVQTRDANHNLIDTTVVFDNLVKKLKSQGAPGTAGFAIASRVASILGINPDDLPQLYANMDEFIAKQEDFKKRQKEAGIDPDDLAAKSRSFQNTMRQLDSDLDLFGQLVLKNFIGPIQAVVWWMDYAVQDINKLDVATDGWSTKLGAVGAALLSIKAAGSALGWAGKLLGIGGGAAAATGGGAAAAAAGGTAGAGAIAGLAAAGTLTAATAGLYYAVKPTQLGNSEVAGKGQNQKVAFDYFVSQGWSPNQAAGLVANLQRESGLDPTRIGDKGQAIGIAQWHKDRQEAYKTWSQGGDLQHATFQDQLAFVNYELRTGNEKSAGAALKSSNSAREAGSSVSTLYERPKDALGEATLRGSLAEHILSSNSPNGTSGPPVVLQQTNHVTVQGVSDPHEAAKAVGKENDRSNGNLLRNLQGNFSGNNAGIAAN